MADLDQGVADVREAVRDRYGAAARGATGSRSDSSCCGPELCAGQEQRFGATLYGQDGEVVPESALKLSLGCGNPTAVADLHGGETVLDLGSGGGTDLVLSSRRVGPRGKVYGLDMTDEMLALARENVAEAGAHNVELIKGFIEDIPLPDSSVDVVISNCVINLSADKQHVFHEAARVLRPGGRFAIADVVADGDMDAQTRRDMQAWTGCIAGALTAAEFVDGLRTAGLDEIEVRETHRVHPAASSAVIRARKPLASECCDRAVQAQCCERSEKDTCCGTAAHPTSCGCR